MRIELPKDYDEQAATLRFLREFEILSPHEQTILEKKIGIDHRYLTNIKGGMPKKKASLPLLVKMARITRKPTDYFLYGEEEYPLKSKELIDVPKVQNILDDNYNWQRIESPQGCYYNKKWLKNITKDPDKLVCMTIYGDSMEPTLLNGDHLKIDTSQIEVTDGSIYAFRYTDTKQIIVRRIFYHHDKIKLVSDNKRYPFEVINMDEIVVMGRAIMSKRLYIIALNDF